MVSVWFDKYGFESCYKEWKNRTFVLEIHFCLRVTFRGCWFSFTGVFWCRLAHPGGPLTTNKAAALAKFLERKLHEPGGLASINPDLLELAVKNAKDTVNASNYYFSSLSLFLLLFDLHRICLWLGCLEVPPCPLVALSVKRFKALGYKKICFAFFLVIILYYAFWRERTQDFFMWCPHRCLKW